MGLTQSFGISIAYDGTAYAGWQVQPDQATVQGVLERAAERLNGEPTRILGAGRTDAGVHALGQVARFSTPRSLSPRQVPRALNAFLPEDVSVHRAVAVDPGFHPIRDALGKHYRYTLRIAEIDDPFDRRHVYRIGGPVDLEAIAQAAENLLGKHDFGAFQKSGSPRRSTERTIARLDVSAVGDYIRIDVVADGFLYGMARNLAGTLLRVGRGDLSAASIHTGLASRSRDIAGPALPARGLCLRNVFYQDWNGRNV